MMISVRLPETLVQELKDLTQKNHYMDLSEQVREVIRKKCLQHTQPYRYELQQMTQNLEKNITTKKETEDKQKLIEELTKIINKLNS